jgi:hypothetical protein
MDARHIGIERFKHAWRIGGASIFTFSLAKVKRKWKVGRRDLPSARQEKL